MSDSVTRWPVASVSRSLTNSEKNYIAIELKCLAIFFACRKFDQYIYGKKTVVENDHKPLEVIAKKSLLSAPRRLQPIAKIQPGSNLSSGRATADC